MGADPPRVQKPTRSAADKPNATRPRFPVNRDAAVAAVTRAVISSIYAGKVDTRLLTPKLRAKFTPAKIKSIRAGLRDYGGLKSITLVSRKPEEGRDIATLKVRIGDTVFIGTMTITADNRMDDFLLLEE